MAMMEIHETELIGLLGSLPGEALPTTDALIGETGANCREIGLDEAWRILRDPGTRDGQSIVPVREGVLMLTDSARLGPELSTLSRDWSVRAVGILAALYEADAGRTSE